MSDESPAWRRLTEAELNEIAPFSLNVEGLAHDAVERVRREFLKMMGSAVSRFLHHLGRPPTQEEGKMLARAVVEYLNACTIPLMAERGRATLQ